VSTSDVDTWWIVSFFDKNLIEVLIWYFSKIKVLYVMRIETQRLKDKVIKTHEPKKCLTQELIQRFW